MLDTLEGFVQQCATASEIGKSFGLPGSFIKDYRNIVCTGLGGSAIALDIARSYIADKAKTPLFVNRNYTLPDFVDSRSLVIAASYSGNTEETLSAYKDAKARNAAIIAISSGGQLCQLALKRWIPINKDTCRIAAEMRIRICIFSASDSLVED